MQKCGAGMRGWFGTGCAVALICACGSPRAGLAQAADPAGPAASTASHDAVHPKTKSNTSAATHKSKAKRATSHRRGKKKATARGQQKIDPERAQAIQEALIREHYVSGEAAGTWNQASEDAMRRLPGGSRLAIENSTGFARSDQPGPGAEPRASAESGERDDDGAGHACVVFEPGVTQR